MSAIHYEPTIQVKITGSEVTPFDISNTFTLDTKLEETHNIQSTSSAKIIDLSNVSNIKELIFYSASSFTVHLIKTITSPLSETFDYTIDIPVNAGYPLILPVNSSFIEGLEEINITTDNANIIKVYVKAYGEVSPTT